MHVRRLIMAVISIHTCINIVSGNSVVKVCPSPPPPPQPPPPLKKNLVDDDRALMCVWNPASSDSAAMRDQHAAMHEDIFSRPLLTARPCLLAQSRGI